MPLRTEVRCDHLTSLGRCQRIPETRFSRLCLHVTTYITFLIIIFYVHVIIWQMHCHLYYVNCALYLDILIYVKYYQVINSCLYKCIISIILFFRLLSQFRWITAGTRLFVAFIAKVINVSSKFGYSNAFYSIKCTLVRLCI